MTDKQFILLCIGLWFVAFELGVAIGEILYMIFQDA